MTRYSVYLHFERKINLENLWVLLVHKGFQVDNKMQLLRKETKGQVQR